MKRFLIIQTAFIGDVVLATPLIEKLHETYPQSKIDFLLRKGNEDLLEGHPLLDKIIIWDKKKGKYAQLIRLIGLLRKEHYDYVINLQRFMTTGIITVLSGAGKTIGFSKNPLSLFFSRKFPHQIDPKNKDIHEVDRNLSLLSGLADTSKRVNPRLYPGTKDFEKVTHTGKYVTLSPASVWFTKQYPLEKWVRVIQLIPKDYTVFLLGGKSDVEACEWLKLQAGHPHTEIMAGKLRFLESAALMKHAEMNYVNDSAPLHFASAVNAPVTAIFCSTVPAFGFGPLSSQSRVVETDIHLYCRPCGLHGYKACPLKHFKCADISGEKVTGNI